MHIIILNVKLESTNILDVGGFLLLLLFLSSDLCHKKMLLESLTIPLMISLKQVVPLAVSHSML